MAQTRTMLGLNFQGALSLWKKAQRRITNESGRKDPTEARGRLRTRRRRASNLPQLELWFGRGGGRASREDGLVWSGHASSLPVWLVRWLAGSLAGCLPSFPLLGVYIYPEGALLSFSCGIRRCWRRSQEFVRSLLRWPVLASLQTTQHLSNRSRSLLRRHCGNIDGAAHHKQL